MYEINFKLLTDEELINFIQKGKYLAFRELFIRYYNDFFNFVYHFFYDEEKSKKIIEKIFINIWCEPYFYDKKFKIYVYKRMIKFLSNIKMNKKILLDLNKKDRLIINLYYFSTLNNDELKFFDKNIKLKLKNLNKNLIKRYNFDLDFFIKEINFNNSFDIKLQNKILFDIMKYKQKDKNQDIIILISIIPMIILLIMILYSFFLNN